MRRSNRVGWATLAAVTLMLCAPLVVAAQPAPGAQPGAQPGDEEAKKKKTGISGILGTMDWLTSDVDVLASIDESLKEEYRDRLTEIRDTLKIDRLMRERRAKYNEIKETLVRFDGQRTGYETSLIAQDYLPNDGESVLRVDDKAAQRYYFFKHGRLWKVVVAYHSAVTRALSFEAFVKQVQAKYGPPARRETGKVEGKNALVAAVWEDELTQLTVENRTGFFGTYVMKFISKAEGLNYEAERADRKPSPEATAGDAKADSLMADIAGGPSSEIGEDVVDRLTGVEHEVDLTAGQTFAKPLVRASDTPSRPVVQQPRGDDPPSRTARGDAARTATDEDDDDGADPPPVEGAGSDVLIY